MADSATAAAAAEGRRRERRARILYGNGRAAAGTLGRREGWAGLTYFFSGLILLIGLGRLIVSLARLE